MHTVGQPSRTSDHHPNGFTKYPILYPDARHQLGSFVSSADQRCVNHGRSSTRSLRRYAPALPSRASNSAAAHPTTTTWSTRARTRTPCMPAGVGVDLRTVAAILANLPYPCRQCGTGKPTIGHHAGRETPARDVPAGPTRPTRPGGARDPVDRLPCLGSRRVTGAVYSFSATCSADAARKNLCGGCCGAVPVRGAQPR